MKKIIVIIVTVLLVFAMLSPAIFAVDTASATTGDGNGGLVERAVIFYDLPFLQDNPEILENRTPDTIIVERCIGVVVNDETGEGKLIYDDPIYNYIYYPPRFSMWDIVVTYNVYNPANQFTDDVLFRFDVKVGNLMSLYDTTGERG